MAAEKKTKGFLFPSAKTQLLPSICAHFHPSPKKNDFLRLLLMLHLYSGQQIIVLNNSTGIFMWETLYDFRPKGILLIVGGKIDIKAENGYKKHLCKKCTAHFTFCVDMSKIQMECSTFVLTFVER